MNNEKMNQIINEVYENYSKMVWRITDIPLYSKEEFINKCKTNPEFSEKWGLKIKERELDMFERWKIADLTPNMMEFDYCNKLCDEHNVPTKLITVAYKDETIEIFE
jgi:hypothetical protein